AEYPMSPSKRLGRWLVYGACIAPAVVMLAYYWLEYIPGQRQYFTNLRFRTLANIGDQIKGKLEALASSLRYATNGEQPVSEYLTTLVRDLDYKKNEECAPPAQPVKPRLVFAGSDTVRFHAEKGCWAEAKLSRIFTRFIQVDLFDDIVIADSNRHVIY